jgi:UDP-3-O-[3-hydroxymyristoyl] glucosamine N-acyltransferase
MKLRDIAERLGCRLEGDPQLEISGVAGIESAQLGELTFLENRRYFPALRTTRASAVLIEEGVFIEREPDGPPLAVLRADNPRLRFAEAMELFFEAPRYLPGTHPTAIVAPSARVGEGAHIGPYCYVAENTVIGDRAVLHSFVTIYRDAHIGDDFFAHAHAVVREGCRIGNRVTLQNGVVVGGDGFGFVKLPDGRWRKMLHPGLAVLEDDVEIQANACVDRASVGETRIRRGAKLDDLVLVGHASQVGENTLLCGQVGLAGTTRVGRGCILAGQVGVAGHLTVGDGAVVTARSGVPNDVPAGAIYSGYPAVENKQWLKNSAALNHLPDLQKKARELEAKVKRLEQPAGRSRKDG